MAPLPHPGWSFAATVGPDRRIYVLGGSNTVGYAPPEALGTAVTAYRVVPAGQPLPTPPPGPTSVARELARMPTGRQNLGVVTATDGRVYALGGRTLGTADEPNGEILGTVEAYNPRKNTWASVLPLLEPRWWFGAAVAPDGRIYVLGGLDQLTQEDYTPPPLATVEIYDPMRHRWSQGKPMPDARAGLAAVTGKDGRIYTIGGGHLLRVQLSRDPHRASP